MLACLSPLAAPKADTKNSVFVCVLRSFCNAVGCRNPKSANAAPETSQNRPVSCMFVCLSVGRLVGRSVGWVGGVVNVNVVEAFLPSCSPWLLLFAHILPWIPRRGVESRLTSVWSPLGKLFIRQHAPASRGGNVPNYEVAKHSLRLLLCMHDTYLSLSKPGTRQQKFKDMFPLPFHTISLYLHGGKMWQECQVSWGVTIRACSLRGFLQAQRDLIRCFFCMFYSYAACFLVSWSYNPAINTSGHGHGHRHGHCHGPQFHSQRGSKWWIWQWRTLADAARCCVALTGRWT